MQPSAADERRRKRTKADQQASGTHWSRAGGCDVRRAPSDTTSTAPVGDTYRVVVNTLLAGATGGFTLRVSELPGPRDPGECGG